MTGRLTRPIVAFTKATSSAVVLRPYCAATHSYPSACRGTISLLKHEPSAQSPWQNTMLGLDSVDVIFFSLSMFYLRFIYSPHFRTVMHDLAKSRLLGLLGAPFICLALAASTP